MRAWISRVAARALMPRSGTCYLRLFRSWMHLRSVPHRGAEDPLSGEPSFKEVTVHKAWFLLELFVLLLPSLLLLLLLLLLPWLVLRGPKSSSAHANMDEQLATSNHHHAAFMPSGACGACRQENARAADVNPPI